MINKIFICPISINFIESYEEREIKCELIHKKGQKYGWYIPFITKRKTYKDNYYYIHSWDFYSGDLYSQKFIEKQEDYIFKNNKLSKKAYIDIYMNNGKYLTKYFENNSDMYKFLEKFNNYYEL